MLYNLTFWNRYLHTFILFKVTDGPVPIWIRYFKRAHRTNLWTEGDGPLYIVDTEDIISVLPPPKVASKGKRKFYEFDLKLTN